MSGPNHRRGLRLIDLTAIVVGYGMAALLVRALWPGAGSPFGGVVVLVGLEYLWLGLAMSGPVVLLFDRRPGARRSPAAVEPPGRGHTGRRVGQRPVRRRPFDRDFDDPTDGNEPASRYTWAELAWLVIGSYWIGMTVVMASVRLDGTVIPLLGLLHLLVIAGFGLFAPALPATAPGRSAWTHKAAVGLLWTWPLAWVDLVLLSKTL